jgi:lipopolysaccharide export LptBFGC system permease protein LptF
MFGAFLIACFLGVAIKLDDWSGYIIARVASFTDLLRISLYAVPQLLPFVLPVTLFFGILGGYGKLATQGEVTAMRAAGVPLRRLLSVGIFLALVLAFVCVVAQQTVQPYVMGRLHHLIAYELPRRATIDTLEPGVVHSLDNWRIYFEASDPAHREISGVNVVKFEQGEGPTVFHADSARIRSDGVGQAIEMGRGFTVMPGGLRWATDRTELPIPLEQVTANSLRDRQALGLAALLSREQELAATYAITPGLRDAIQLRRIRQEIADRLSLPFASVSLAMTAVPFVLLMTHHRRGTRTRMFGVGLLIALGYYTVRIGVQFNTLMPLATVLGLAWVPNVLLFVVGAGMYWRLARTH